MHASIRFFCQAGNLLMSDLGLMNNAYGLTYTLTLRHICLLPTTTRDGKKEFLRLILLHARLSLFLLFVHNFILWKFGRSFAPEQKCTLHRFLFSMPAKLISDLDQRYSLQPIAWNMTLIEVLHVGPKLPKNSTIKISFWALKVIKFF